MAKTLIPRSESMLIAGYFLARFSKDGKPPEFLNVSSWTEIYERIYPSIGEGRTFKTFVGSMTPVRNACNHHFDNGGPVHRDNKGKIGPLTENQAIIAANWDSKSDEDLLRFIAATFPGLIPGRQ